MSEAKHLNPASGTPEPFVDLSSLATPVPKSAHAVTLPRSRRLPRRMTNVALILTLVGLFAFAVGAGVALAVLGGSLDLSTGWVKDLLGTLKDLAQQFKK